MADTTVEQGGIADTLMTSGSVTTPAAGAAIATITTPGAGVYSVQVVAVFTGTAPAAADLTNLELRHGSTVAGKLMGSTTPVPVQRERLTVAAGENVTVNATALGTTGTIYTVFLAITKIAAPAEVPSAA